MRRIALAVLALVLCVPALAGGKDRVYKKGDNKPLEGTIEKEDFNGVTIKMEGATSGVTWDKWASTDYGDKPMSLVTAEQAESKGDLAGAAEAFQKAADELKERPVFLAHALWGAGRCRMRLSRWDDAAKSFEDLNKALPTNRWMREAWSNLIECLLQKGDTAAADKAAAAANEAGKAAQAGQDFTLAMQLKQAQILELAKDYPTAIGKFQAVAGSASAKFPDIEGQAQLGVARCQMATNPTSAQGTYESITRKFKTQRLVMGAAWTGLGDCFMAQAAGGDADKYRQAALAYSRTCVLYFPPDGASTTAIERALVGGAECYLALAQKAEGSAKGVYAGQARSMAMQLLDQYTNSAHKAKATELRGKADEELAKAPRK